MACADWFFSVAATAGSPALPAVAAAASAASDTPALVPWAGCLASFPAPVAPEVAAVASVRVRLAWGFLAGAFDVRLPGAASAASVAALALAVLAALPARWDLAAGLDLTASSARLAAWVASLVRLSGAAPGSLKRWGYQCRQDEHQRPRCCCHQGSRLAGWHGRVSVGRQGRGRHRCWPLPC